MTAIFFCSLVNFLKLLCLMLFTAFRIAWPLRMTDYKDALSTCGPQLFAKVNNRLYFVCSLS